MRIGRLLALSLILVLGIAGAALAAGNFDDDDGNVHEPDIEAIAAEGITRGCNPPQNNLFCPDDPVTRGQMAAFLVRALDLTDDDDDDDFEDTDDSVFEDDIEALAAAGITRGCNPPANDRFCPDDHVTRGQMAAFLVRALGYTDDGGGDHFDDDDTSVFESDIDRLRTAGVTFGCNPPDNTRFCPDDHVTRGQMASFLTRALDLTPITPPPPPPPPPPGDDFCADLPTSVDDNIEIPNGETCTLNGTQVGGNVIVGTTATLNATGVFVDGNVQAEGHASVTVDESEIQGDIQADDGAAVTVLDTFVDGNIQLEGNSGAIDVTGNVVGGDIQVNDNTGGTVISNNTVDGNLQCQGNNPAPTGTTNTVGGNKEGQCSGL